MDSSDSLTQDDRTAIRRQLQEGQTMLRETVDRLRQSQEENEMITRRRDELEARVTVLETDYEELLGTWAFAGRGSSDRYRIWAEKTIHDEEANNVDVAEMMADLKVSIFFYLQRNTMNEGRLE